MLIPYKNNNLMPEMGKYVFTHVKYVLNDVGYSEKYFVSIDFSRKKCPNATGLVE